MKKSIKLLGKFGKNQMLDAIVLLIRDTASRYCSNFDHFFNLSIKGKIRMINESECLIAGRGPSKIWMH